MQPIQPLGTATQIGEWLGVIDSGIPHVMERLYEAGLEPVVNGHPNKQAPVYNTVRAFRLFIEKLGMRPPAENL